MKVDVYDRGERQGRLVGRRIGRELGRKLEWDGKRVGEKEKGLDVKSGISDRCLHKNIRRYVCK